MRPTYTFLTLLFAFVLALPPKWCQAFDGARFECCPACADDDCHNSSGSIPKHECQCENLAAKQSEQVSIDIAPLSVEFIIAANDFPVAFVSIDHIATLRDFQQTLCCWRK